MRFKFRKDELAGPQSSTRKPIMKSKQRVMKWRSKNHTKGYQSKELVIFAKMTKTE